MRVSSIYLAFGLAVNAHAAEMLPVSAENSQPSMELLEFIGEWETSDGEWFDPLGDSEPAKNREKQDEK